MSDSFCDNDTVSVFFRHSDTERTLLGSRW